jgi:hypothetical protein
MGNGEWNQNERNRKVFDGVFWMEQVKVVGLGVVDLADCLDRA